MLPARPSEAELENDLWESGHVDCREAPIADHYSNIACPSLSGHQSSSFGLLNTVAYSTATAALSTVAGLSCPEFPSAGPSVMQGLCVGSVGVGEFEVVELWGLRSV